MRITTKVFTVNKIGVCECAISELKGDLREKASMCRAQAREIEDLRFRIKETELLRVERDSLAVRNLLHNYIVKMIDKRIFPETLIF